MANLGDLGRICSAETASGIGRRNVIKLLGGATVAWPLAARAQQPTDRVQRIGFLTGYAEGDGEAEALVTTFRQGLQELGWVEGRNLRIDYRWAVSDPNRMRTYAAELVGLAPTVIMAESTPLVAALQQETRTVPIVFAAANDPVGFGFVASLARPGGNITGFIGAGAEPSMGGKWLEILKEVAPGVGRIALIFNPQTHTGQYFGSIEVAASSFAMEAIKTPIHDAAEIKRAIDAFALAPTGGLLVLPDITTNFHRDLIVALAARHRLPAVYAFPSFPRNGGLVSYGAGLADLYRRAASYVDRILRGAKPSDLPVQLPTKFELVINLKTAKALGLDVPLQLQQRADEVIE
jgi:putative ABC transport system substrate-binding protein